MNVQKIGNMQKQQGLSLLGLVAWLIIVALGAMLTIKVMPEVIDYASSVKVIKAIAGDAAMQAVPDSVIKESFGKRAEIDNIRGVSGDDLIIDKTSGALVISFEYSKKIPLFGPVSLVIDFKGASNK